MPQVHVFSLSEKTGSRVGRWSMLGFLVSHAPSCVVSMRSHCRVSCPICHVITLPCPTSQMDGQPQLYAVHIFVRIPPLNALPHQYYPVANDPLLATIFAHPHEITSTLPGPFGGAIPRISASPSCTPPEPNLQKVPPVEGVHLILAF